MPSRRQFIAATAGAALATTWPVRAEDLLQRTIPSSGERVPAIGLGTWQNFDLAPDSAAYPDAALTLQRFVEGGGRVLDSSPMYGRSSHTLGELARQQGVADQLFYASKVWTRGHLAGRQQFDSELARFERPQLDLMQVHNLSDVSTQLRVLREAREQGQLRLIGISHYLASAHPEVERVLRGEALDVLQINYSIIEPEAERSLLALAEDRGVAVFANRVFAEGALFQRVRGVEIPAFARDIGIDSWARYFLKWVLGTPRVALALLGTGNPRHMADNIGALRGPLPDPGLRRRMAEFVRSL